MMPEKRVMASEGSSLDPYETRDFDDLRVRARQLSQ